MTSPSALVRTALINKLANALTGFNTVYGNVVDNYPGAGDIAIDFNLLKSYNFFQGRVSVDDIIATGAYKWPAMCAWASAGQNKGKQKPCTWDGAVSAGVAVYLSGQSYAASALVQNFEGWADAVEDAMIQVVNSYSNQNWGSGVIYDGQIGYERPAPRKAGENWLQEVYFKMLFEVVIP